MAFDETYNEPESTEVLVKSLDQTPTGGSSEEYWSMDASLNQPCRVQEDGSMSCKLLLY